MTRQGAINAFCRACICDPANGGGTWKEQVAGCTATSCPLFAFRPLPEYCTGPARERWRNPVHVAGFNQLLPDAFRRAFREDCKGSPQGSVGGYRP